VDGGRNLNEAKLVRQSDIDPGTRLNFLPIELLFFTLHRTTTGPFASSGGSPSSRSPFDWWYP